MTAEWKKTAIERTKRKNDLAQAQAELKMFKDRFAEVKQAAAYYKEEYARARKYLFEAEKLNRRYEELRAQGILLEVDGEFKYLKGADLDAFFDGRHTLSSASLEAAISKLQTMTTPQQVAVHGEMVYGINT